jgi:hypothetical protein
LLHSVVDQLLDNLITNSDEQETTIKKESDCGTQNDGFRDNATPVIDGCGRSGGTAAGGG